LLEDLAPATLTRLEAEGYDPAAVVETSPGSFQAWLKHLQPLTKRTWHPGRKNTCRAVRRRPQRRRLAKFGRAPGFTNRKPQHRNAQGWYPFARFISHTGQPFVAAEPFRSQLVALHFIAEQERAAARLSFAVRQMRYPATVTLSSLRKSPRYQGRPAAADMAFSLPPTVLQCKRPVFAVCTRLSSVVMMWGWWMLS